MCRETNSRGYPAFKFDPKDLLKVTIILATILLLSCSSPEVNPTIQASDHTVVILYSGNWKNADRAVALIEDFAAKTTIQLVIRKTLIETEKDVLDHKFIGSPTIRIGGLDVDPSARSVSRFGFYWRLDNWLKDAVAAEEILRNAFREAGWIDPEN